MSAPIVAANWKMHKTFSEGMALAAEIQAQLQHKKGATVVLIPGFLHLQALSEQLQGQHRIRLGAQNCHYEPEGAYTGEIAAPQLRALSVDYVLMGHSERRLHFQEDSKLLKAKVSSALEAGLRPIFCCGEPLQVREANQQVDYVSAQLSEGLSALEVPAFERLIIAYEPLWAIGTGQTATPAQAQAMHSALRGHLSRITPQAAATPILYGGSVKPQNAAELAACPDINGVLVGGASLQAAAFLEIVAAFD